MHAITLILLAASAAEPLGLDSLVKETTAANKPIVVDVFTTWCVPCAMLDKNVFADPKVGAVLATARFARYDAERGVGIDVAERLNVRSYPTVLVLTPDGTQIGRITAQEPAEFIAQATPLIKFATVKGPFTDEAVAKKDVDARVVYIAALKAMNGSNPNITKAIALFDQAAAKDPNDALGVKSQAVSQAARARYANAVIALKVKTLLDLAQGDPASTATTDALGTLSNYPGKFDAAQVKALTNKMRATLTASKNKDQLESLLYAQLALLDMEGALAAAKVVETLDPGPNSMDSIAEAYFQANQKERAIELQTAAVKAAPGNRSLERNLARFKTEEPSPPPFSGMNPLDSLEPEAKNPRIATFLAQGQFGASVVEECKTAAGKVKGAWLRVAFTGAKVTKVQAFDVETPPALRKCLEKVALTKAWTEPSGHSPAEFEIRFPAQL